MRHFILIFASDKQHEEHKRQTCFSPVCFICPRSQTKERQNVINGYRMLSKNNDIKPNESNNIK